MFLVVIISYAHSQKTAKTYHLKVIVGNYTKELRLSMPEGY